MNLSSVDEKSVYQDVLLPALEKARDTIPFFETGDSLDKLVLYGAPGAVLDSLNLVTFVFMLEEEVAARYQHEIKITTQDVLDTDTAPFSSLENLSRFLVKKIQSSGESRG
jgi:hypothetical protein